MNYLTARIIGAGILIATSAMAQAQLVSQSVEDGARICTYDKTNAVTGQRETLRLGLGQPCPFLLPPPETEAAEPVPFMAQLRRETNRRGQRICIYALAGREYEHALPITQPCPLTPYFN